MGQTILVDEDRRAGEVLLRHLDKVGFPVTAALWWLEPETREWKLIFASPLVDRIGPRDSYMQLRSAYQKVGEMLPVNLRQIALVSPGDSLIQLLRVALSTGEKDVSAITFSRNTINGVFVEDAYIYRLSS